MLQELRLNAKIVNQFATTAVSGRVTNPSPMPQEASFTFRIPDNALVSNLTMTVDDVVHVATPQNQTAAQTSFLAAKGDNSSAILVSVDRHSRKNKVKVTTHLQGFQTVTFTLTYEEYIFKKNGRYSHSLKMASEVSVEMVEADVFITQSNVKRIKIAQISTPNRACQNIIMGPTKTRAKATTKSSPRCPIHKIGADGRFHLDLSVQYTLADNGTHDLATDGSYFVHFLSPESLTIFPKHIVCIADVTMDQGGNQLQQMQDALIRIINMLTDVDKFQLITYNGDNGTNTWPNRTTSIVGSESDKQDAIEFVRSLRVGRGRRSIDQMLLAAIRAASLGNLRANTKKMIFFLTEGSPVTATDKSRILNIVLRENRQNRFPIHGIAFGSDPDLEIIELVIPQNYGKAIRLKFFFL